MTIANQLYSQNPLGLNVQVLIVDVPCASSITRITRSATFPFPQDITEIASDFIPLLEITWKVKQEMLANTKSLQDKKRKAAALYVDDGEGRSAKVPFSFARH